MTNLVRWRHCLLFKIYTEKTARKTVKGTKRLLGVTKTEKILLYTPLIKWYLQHGLRLTAVHQLVESLDVKKWSLARPLGLRFLII